MTIAITNNLSNGARVSNGDVIGVVSALDKFIEENKELFDNYLVLDGNAWSTDEAHARKHGRVLCLDFSATGTYKFDMRDNVAEYLRDPRRYNGMRSPFRRSSPTGNDPYAGYLTVVVIPCEGASPRQLEMFRSINVFMGAMGAEWNRRVAVNANVTGQQAAAMAAQAQSAQASQATAAVP